MSDTTQENTRENLYRILALIQNPSCNRLKKDYSLHIKKESSTWRPRKSFIDWAQNDEILHAGFAPYFPTNSIHKVPSHTEQKEGLYIHKPLVHFPYHKERIPIRPDATIIHEQEEKIIEFCCQPEREGNTSRYALHTARLRAAIYSYAKNPRNPCTKAFIVLHRWTKLVVHIQNIEHEINQIREAILQEQDPSTSYHFLPSCRWFCSLSEQCHEQATKSGNPLAWSPSLQNILLHDVWSTKNQTIHPKESQLHILKHFYTKAFSENS